jgi:hypothetical protein
MKVYNLTSSHDSSQIHSIKLSISENTQNLACTQNRLLSQKMNFFLQSSFFASVRKGTLLRFCVATVDKPTDAAKISSTEFLSL